MDEVEFLPEGITPPLPARVGRKQKFQEFAETLRQNPGRWAKLPEQRDKPRDRAMLTYNINRNGYRGLPADEFEARTTKGEIWVRYKKGVPDDDQ